MMEAILTVGLITFLWTVAQKAKGGKQLMMKFVRLGEMKGMTRQQIVNAVGHPTSMTIGEQGVTAVEWRAGTFRAVLGFFGDSCIGVLHQSIG